MHDSSFGRLLAVLVAPGRTFRSIAERPTWLVPMVISVLLIGVVATVVMQKADMGEMVRARIEQSGREMPQEAIDQQVEFMEKFGWIFGIVGTLFTSVMYVIAAAVLLAIFKLLGSDLTFKQSLSTYLYGVAPLIVASLLALPVMLSRESLSIEEVQGGSVLMSNLSFLAPEDAGAATRAALASLDVFSIWVIVLLVIGYRIVARVSTAAAAGTVIGLWLVVVLGKIGWAAAFG